MPVIDEQRVQQQCGVEICSVAPSSEKCRQVGVGALRALNFLISVASAFNVGGAPMPLIKSSKLRAIASTGTSFRFPSLQQVTKKHRAEFQSICWTIDSEWDLAGKVLS
jgi:hypothetical protein